MSTGLRVELGWEGRRRGGCRRGRGGAAGAAKREQGGQKKGDSVAVMRCHCGHEVKGCWRGGGITYQMLKDLGMSGLRDQFYYCYGGA